MPDFYCTVRLTLALWLAKTVVFGLAKVVDSISYLVFFWYQISWGSKRAEKDAEKPLWTTDWSEIIITYTSPSNHSSRCLSWGSIFQTLQFCSAVFCLAAFCFFSNKVCLHKEPNTENREHHPSIFSACPVFVWLCSTAGSGCVAVTISSDLAYCPRWKSVFPVSFYVV